MSVSISERVSAIYSYKCINHSCQICCNWSRLKPGFITSCWPVGIIMYLGGY